jgi:mannose-6-phosphate isomerase-like protein (cupin superfamily)
MSPATTGRTLDADGQPVAGTGFSYEPESRLADAIRSRRGPLTSHPTRPSWGTLPTPVEGTEDVHRALSILGPGYDGPPRHYHEVSEEHFRVLRGEVVFDLDGTERRVSAGETVTVETGVPHSFRCPEGGEIAVMRTEISPPGRIGHVLPTLGGLAHDPEVDADNPLQQAAIAKRLEGDTVFLELDRRVAKPLTDALAPVARLRGYRGGYAKYAQPAFWERHVEQPAD